MLADGLSTRGNLIGGAHDEDIAVAISDHYLPTGTNSEVPKKPIKEKNNVIDLLFNLYALFLKPLPFNTCFIE